MPKAYEFDDVLMFFKKRYCHCCGGKLSIRSTEKVVDKNEYTSSGRYQYVYNEDVTVIGKEYYCSKCDKSFSCDEQEKVNQAQKLYQRKIVSDGEISNIINQNQTSSLEKLSKLKWTLLIPVIGHFICTAYIFSGELSNKTAKGDLHKLTISTLLVFIGVALVVKLVLSMFNGIEFINNSETVLMLIPSLLSFNMPVLWYINNKIL